MPARTALITGASVAGPATAFWLDRYGWRTTVVERAPALRPGGQSVDLRGPGLDVIRRMGLEECVRARLPGELGLEFVDQRGRVIARFPVGEQSAVNLSTEVEILRGDLAEVLVDATAGRTEYRYGDHVTAVEADDGGALVRFAHAPEERFDLVVAADGIGSSTRRLAFPGAAVVRPLGVEATWATIPRVPSDTDWWRLLHAPGGTVSLRPDRAGTTGVVITRTLARSDAQDSGERRAPRAQRQALRRTFEGAGWETPRILAELDRVDDLYTVGVGQVHAPAWHNGRVVLVGDAAYCPSAVTGMGTTLAVVGAYVLAGELATHGAVQDGLAAYERVLRPWVTRVQRLPPGIPRIANPTTQLGVALLRSVVRAAATPAARWLTGRIAGLRQSADDFMLPHYSQLHSD